MTRTTRSWVVNSHTDYRTVAAGFAGTLAYWEITPQDARFSGAGECGSAFGPGRTPSLRLTGMNHLTNSFSLGAESRADAHTFAPEKLNSRLIALENINRFKQNLQNAFNNGKQFLKTNYTHNYSLLDCSSFAFISA